MGDPFRTLASAIAADPTQTYPLAADLMSALAQMGQVEFGTYTGTGAAITVVTNGNPRCVFLYNQTQQCLGIHVTGMTAAHVFKIDNAAVAHASTDGLTLGTNQFTIGADADINTAADAGFWMALI